MKFLRNVRQGDKRIIVVNGEVLGAVLRLPPRGSWLCNAAQVPGSARLLPTPGSCGWPGRW
ncbi:MAG: hypothetical protein H6559_12470 [Lewinellaceae bacterium]|nr:hypothetical protein [Lewinellaceae bacterium]